MQDRAWQNRNGTVERECLYRTEATLSEWRLELTSCLHDFSARFGQLDYSQPPRSRILSVLNDPSTPHGISEWRELTLLTGRVSLEI